MKNKKNAPMERLLERLSEEPTLALSKKAEPVEEQAKKTEPVKAQVKKAVPVAARIEKAATEVETPLKSETSATP